VCGIGGVLTLSSLAPGRVALISRSLRHRGPDDEGFLALDRSGSYESFRGDDTVPELGDMPHWNDAEPGRFALAMCSRRLSILDLSPAGHQPMVFRDGDLALAFNGEIYNYLELAEELESMGWRLTPCGDTAVLLAAFAEWGPSCVERLRGMWAFAIHDRRTNRLTLSRDRFGIKPLYYARYGDSLVFASEIKGVLAALPGDPRGSTPAIVRLLTWGGLDRDEATLFEDVRAVPAGCTIHVSGRDLTITKDPYYDIADRARDPFAGSLEDAVEEYRHRLSESIRLHMRSDVRVGACLSGGLDSSLIASHAASELGEALLATFTAVYDDPSLDERRYVDLLSTCSSRLAPQLIAPSADGLLRDLDRLVLAQDQPLASTSPYAQWAVMQLAGASGMKVLLDGQGADEAIGGYSYFAGEYLLELVRRGRIAHAVGEARRLRDRRRVRVLREIGRAAFGRLPAGIAREARRRLRIGGELVVPQFRSLAGDPPRRAARTYRDQCVDALQRSLPQLLRYEDRSSMAFSIESRVPFLDHPLVELVLSFPTELKYHRGWSKFVQRKAAVGRLPAEIVWRRDKLGFATPQKAWQRATRDAMRELVSEVDMPAFLDREEIDRLVSSGPASAANLSGYWQALFLLRWMHVFRVRFT
jgi:asparagine synthase (glutamine-hydrolysing)